ncbi:phage tail tape measure protein [Aeromonas allosaccharophila]|uniref:hypothetical protein n=1 Tax=Aeromonas allosaccharophila TaxID=656 RepID=UPI0036DD1D23
MSEILISKITNIIDFKIHESNYKKSVQRLKKMAGMWGKVTSQYDKAMQAGQRVAKGQEKSIKASTRAEIRQIRTRKQTLKADQIRYRDQIQNNDYFRKGLQRINSDFLKGNTSFAERSAQIGQLNKQYKQLNNQASKHNKISRIIGASGAGVRGMAGSATTTAAIGVGTVGAAGYAAQRGFDAVKESGQKYESLIISLRNTFNDQAADVSNQIRQIATEGGRDLISTGNQLVNYVSIVKSLGIDTKKAIDMFKKQTNMTASYGMNNDQVAGFQYGLVQTMSSNTLEDFKQFTDWSPQIKADLLKFVKDTMGISQKQFMGNLTNGKYNFKDIWLKFVEASAPRYTQMAQGYKQSSMAQDARASNSVSIALFRVFSSTGFADAMKYATSMINRFGVFLEINSNSIGEVFGNLYRVTGELADGAFKELTSWLKDLKADDIKAFFNDFKQGLSDLAFVVKSVASFIRSFLPEEYKAPSREVAAANTAARSAQTGNWRDTATTYGPKIQQPTFIPPTFENSLVLRGSRNAGVPTSNFSGTLDLKVNATVNETGFSNLVDFKIDDFNRQQINMVGGF